MRLNPSNMPGRGSLGSYGFHNLVELLKLHGSSRSKTRSLSPGYCQGFVVTRIGCSFHQSGLMTLINSSKETWREQDINMVKKDESNNNLRPQPLPPPPPSPPRFNFAMWAKLIFGSLLSFLLPFWGQKWQKIRQIEGEAELVVEGVEKVAEVVEKVANVSEKVSKDVAESLPDDAKLKQAVLFVERIAEQTAQDAHVAGDFIHKVDAVMQDLDALETMVEPLINKVTEKISMQENAKSSAAKSNINR